MNKIISRRELNSCTTLLEVCAPMIAKKANPGQFVILRIDNEGERIPFSIYDSNPTKGTISIIVRIVGASTKKLSGLRESDSITDIVGPLGRSSDMNGEHIAIVCAGIGAATAYPVAKKYVENKKAIHTLAIYDSKETEFISDELSALGDTSVVIMNENDSEGLTAALANLLERDSAIDEVRVFGSLCFMRDVCRLTKERGIKTTVSMNTIMLDGTGICGGCRLTVGGKIVFACVDGPEFDGHSVNFDEAILRADMYSEFEDRRNREHKCNLTGKAE